MTRGVHVAALQVTSDVAVSRNSTSTWSSLQFALKQVTQCLSQGLPLHCAAALSAAAWHTLPMPHRLAAPGAVYVAASEQTM